jgi:acetylornithine deacetylase/succinyl-diaminopimelate desuccinylase-like protein
MTERISSESIKRLLADQVGIKSTAPEEMVITEYLSDVLKRKGFKVEKQVIDESGRTNLLCKKGDNASILFYGHMDTVTVVNPSEWKTDPFKLEEIDGKLYGLGASDMKGGVSSFIEAASKSDTPVKLFLAVDEENISEGAWKAVTERKDFFNGIDLIISAEPSFHMGLNGIATGRTGRCIYQINFKGKPEHIIKYKEAIDALEKLSNFGYLLYKNRENMFKSTNTVAQLRKVSGESKGMSVTGEAQVEIEVILGAEDSVQNIQEELQKFSNDPIEVKPRKTPYLEGYEFKTFPYKKILEEVINKHTGKNMTLNTRKSVGDDNVLATLKIPVLTWGPEGGNEHAANEYVMLKSLDTLANMYKEFLDEVLKKNKK